jgi:shikimate kinase
MKQINKTIVLVGMMGAGKTALGKQLAAKLGLPFIDSDTEIEKATGNKISDIFAEAGEPAFRLIEKNKIAKLLDGKRCVLSTGGGAIVDADTRALIKDKSISIWLKARVETLAARVAKDKNRPLLKTANPKAKLAELLAIRTPFYETAHIHIDTDVHSTDVTLDEMVEKLRGFEVAQIKD